MAAIGQQRYNSGSAAVPSLSVSARCARTRLDRYMISRESCAVSVSMVSNSSAPKRGMPVTVSARNLPSVMSAGLFPVCNRRLPVFTLLS
jgi:hypothetical protein